MSPTSRDRPLGRRVVICPAQTARLIVRLGASMNHMSHTRRSLAEALARIGRALTDARDPEESLSLLVEAAIAELGADGAAVLRVTDDGLLRVAIMRNLPARMSAWTTEGDVFGEELADRVREASGGAFAQAEVFPLVADRNVYGTLVLVTRSPRVRESDEIREIQGLVDLAAVAIGRAVQYAELERAYRDLEASRQALLREIESRAQAETELRRQRDFVQRVIDNAEAIVLVRDVHGNIVLYNSYVERVLGRPLSETIGKSWFDIFVAPSHRELSRDIFRRVLAEGDAVGYASVLLTRDGHTRDVEWRTTLLRDGDVPSVLSVGHDVTERKLADERLRHLEKAAQERGRLADIGAISAQIAHDLGNPLSGVSMQAQLIIHRGRRQPDAPLSTVLKQAELLVSEVRRLEGLLREFLTFAREQRLEVSSFEVGSLVREVVELWQPVGGEKGITVSTELRDSGPSVEADEGKLRRVLDNLVKNAIEAIGQGPGEVKLSVGMPSADRVRISVEDTGPGIADSIDPFRLFGTTKKSGTGLGLAIAKQIMIAHGGDVSFEPREPHGTRFHAVFPVRSSRDHV
jgi:PAS domain S-box-containing protein